MQVKISKPTILPTNFACIPLTGGLVTLVSIEDLDWLSRWKWKAVRSSFCFYACRDIVLNGTEIRLRMHRVICKCPDGFVVHHKNRRSLDNRRSNLMIVTDEQHHKFHNFSEVVNNLHYNANGIEKIV